MTSANRSDISELEQVLKETPLDPGIYCFADKGYASQANRAKLKEYHLKDGIMHKAARGKKLSRLQRIVNYFISKRRVIIDRIFGHLKRNLSFP